MKKSAESIRSPHRWRVGGGKPCNKKGQRSFAGSRDPASRNEAQDYEPGESPDELKKLIVQNESLKNRSVTVGQVIPPAHKSDSVE